MKIAYLGPKNTYSEQAAEKLAETLNENPSPAIKRQGPKKDAELTEQPSLEAIAKLVRSRETDRGVLPYYNYLDGLVQESLNLIYENDLAVEELHRLPLRLSAGLAPDSEANGQTAVYSHPKALAQSSQWLWENYPGIEKRDSGSTAAAARQVAETGSGIAIANQPALEENGLETIAADIGNKKNNRSNFTDFYLVKRQEDLSEETAGYNSSREKTGPDKYLTMVAITPCHDEKGQLAEILHQVAYHGLNNAKIHSRPALYEPPEENSNGLDPQMFYLEIITHQTDPNFERCVDSLRYRLGKGEDAETVRVLGSYTMPKA